MSATHLVLGLSVVGVLAAGCTSNGTAAPAPTVTVTETETPATPGSSRPDPTQPSTGPWGDPLLLVDGRWRVGEDADIPPTGALFTPGAAYDCTWRVTDASGAVVEEVTVTNPSGAFVSLEDGDLFESVDCTVWRFVDLSEPSDFSLPGGPEDVGEPVLPGTYIVGENIRAGTYSQRADSLSGECEYSLKRDNGVRRNEVISFETTNVGGRSRTNEVLDLKNGDIFETTCGSWQRYVWKD